MIKFHSYDLQFINYEDRIRFIKDFAQRYSIIQFLDRQTKRSIFLYDWTTKGRLGKLLKPKTDYYVGGRVNTSGGKMNWLIITEIGEIREGRIFKLGKWKEEGLTQMKEI